MSTARARDAAVVAVRSRGGVDRRRRRDARGRRRGGANANANGNGTTTTTTTIGRGARVVVVGARGGVGQVICAKLHARGYDVVAVSRGRGTEETTTTGPRSVGGVDCRDARSIESDGVYCDFARQRVTHDTMTKLYDLARAAGVKEKINAMFNGEAINSTENRAVLHVATRAPKDKVINVDGKNVVPDVHDVLDKIKDFSERVRNGEWVGETGKPLKDVVAIGIGGSFLGPLFVHTSLRTNPEAADEARGRQLRFLANVDPVDVARSLNGLDPETTLVIVVSKTFTTAETMLNARTVRAWIRASLGEAAVSKHMVAISTNLKLVEEFGIDPDNAFAFWDWVGGRYSVCSAVGMLPLSLQYGYDTMEQFLKGAWSMDQHFANAPFEKNLPLTLGMLSVWNVSFLDCPARAILPYTQALAKLAPHTVSYTHLTLPTKA